MLRLSYLKYILTGFLKQKTISIGGILFVSLVLCIISSFSIGLLTINRIPFILLITCGSIASGSFIIKQVFPQNTAQNPFVTFFIGLLTNSIFYLVSEDLFILINIFLSLVSLVKLRFYKIAITPKNIVYSLVVIAFTLLIINKTEMLFHIFRTIPEVKVGSGFIWPDPFIFTNIVESLKTHGLEYICFEKDTRMFYHFGGYLPAAIISEFFGLSSYFALYSIWIPLNQLVFCILISMLIRYNVNDKVSINTQTITLLLFFLIQPINYRTLLFDNPSTGIGFTLPSENAGTSVGLNLLLVIIIIFQKYIHRDKGYNGYSELFLIGFFILCLELVKVPMFTIALLFVGMYALMDAIQSKSYKLLTLMVITFLISIVLFSIFISNPLPTKHFLIDPFFLVEHIKEFSKHSFTGFPAIVISTLIFCGLLITWLHFKIIAFRTLIKDNKITLSIIITGILIFCLTNIFVIKGHISNPTINLDSSFDLMQFWKAFLFLISIIIIPEISYKIIESKRLFENKWLNAAFIAFICCSFIGFLLPLKNIEYETKENTWLTKVIQEIKGRKKPNELLAISPRNSVIYLEQLIASDQGDFWVSVSAEGGYNFSIQNKHRWVLCKQLLSPINRNIVFTKKDLEYLKNTIFVATPSDSAIYQKSVNFVPVENTSWLYRVSPIILR